MSRKGRQSNGVTKLHHLRHSAFCLRALLQIECSITQLPLRGLYFYDSHAIGGYTQQSVIFTWHKDWKQGRSSEVTKSTCQHL